MVGLMVWLGLFGYGLEPVVAKPLKVFILAGQSNMEGHARVSAFDHIGMDPRTVPMLHEMRGEDGTPRVCDQVWISYLTGPGEGGEGFGKLTAGYGARKVPTEDGGKIGPEFTFGIYMHQFLDEPILLIKTAWGGKSLHTDFRPPRAPPFAFREEQLARFKEQGKDPALKQAEKAEASGRYYRLMIQHVNRITKDIARVCPSYDPEQGYELAGFVWFQGWNDMVAQDVYPNRSQPGGYDQYSELLAQFIRDVRRDLHAPQMHFVIGVMGVNGPLDTYTASQQRYKGTHGNFRQAMAAPATWPEFRGNVTAVLTEKCWDPELDAVAAKTDLLKAKTRALREADTLSRPEQQKALEAYRATLYTARDLELLTGITNAAYHYRGSPKIMGLIGKAFAEAMAAGLAL